MKPFNLEEYLKNPNRKVITRDGRVVRKILCVDANSKHYPIVALIKSKDGNEEYPLRYTVNGQYCRGYEKQVDLFFASEKHEGWVNVYKEDKFYNVGNLFSSKEDALAVTKGGNIYVATIKIEWEEK